MHIDLVLSWKEQNLLVSLELAHKTYISPSTQTPALLSTFVAGANVTCPMTLF
jgi:hypothetical protein